MGLNRDINYINIIQNALTNYQGFTSGEKKYCTEHLSEWISEENGLEVLISKFQEEKSLDVRPFLQQTGLMA